MQNIKLQLDEELENYIKGKAEFSPYYPGMSILTSNLYKEQLKETLKHLEEEILWEITENFYTAFVFFQEEQLYYF